MSLPLLVTRLMPTPPVCCDVVAAGADLHLLQHVEVVVHGRCAGGDLSEMSTPSSSHLLLVVVAPREM